MAAIRNPKDTAVSYYNFIVNHVSIVTATGLHTMPDEKYNWVVKHDKQTSLEPSGAL